MAIASTVPPQHRYDRTHPQNPFAGQSLVVFRSRNHAHHCTAQALVSPPRAEPPFVVATGLRHK